MGVEGVPLNQLHCPTCGRRYCDYRLHTDEEDYVVDHIVSPIKAFATGRKFLLCPDGHRWTVKTIWRRTGYPDLVQLGEYVGTA